MIENLTWLVFCIYFEARGEPIDAQVGVAQVVMNRVSQRRLSIREVVTQYKQFSWYNGLSIPEIEEPEILWKCVKSALNCFVRRAGGDIMNGANHFHDISVKPYWASSQENLGRVGNFEFYKDY